MNIFCIREAFICLKTNPHYEEAGYFYQKNWYSFHQPWTDEQLIYPSSRLVWIRTGNLWIGIPAM